MTPARIIAAVMILGGIAFGALGGEYSTLNWWTLRKQVAEERGAVERLRVEVDSLSGVAKALETDPAVQEKVARESFGMLRPGEIEYRVETGR
ncbi:MAG: septum formation initiator family protein [Gemmatimonadetes bacterium]|nr:septum formation initiator family protein [Gemmatimonadota bacterium]